MLLAHLALAQSAPTAEVLFDAKLMEQVREIDAHLDGVLGVYAIDLNTGRSLSFHGETVFAQASSIKIPILIELFHQARAGKFHLIDHKTLEHTEGVCRTERAT